MLSAAPAIGNGAYRVPYRVEPEIEAGQLLTINDAVGVR